MKMRESLNIAVFRAFVNEINADIFKKKTRCFSFLNHVHYILCIYFVLCSVLVLI